MKPAPQKKLYNNIRWRRARSNFLDQNPFCTPCLLRGVETPATVVHHKTPHKGDSVLFWDVSNWEAVCAPCHNASLRLKELHGYNQSATISGFPIDPDHPWNK